jgi:Rps23 Pro-64 3,4-dihydroxylase Tpa1-like proline 4-hydroxylase
MIEKYNEPFDYFVIDNFLDEDLALKLSSEFPAYDSKDWYTYDNPLENKKALNNWYLYPSTTYAFLHDMNSDAFVSQLEEITGETLFPDMGLHGGGWHIHGNGGKLNVHLDYSLHPKLHLQRKYNLILYLSPDWDTSWGGNLELWSHNDETKLPKEKVATVECKFNRAIIFDASMNSWHGFNDPINCPEGMYRKSIAIYYLKQPDDVVDDRQRALYAPTKEQQNDPSILEFIKVRAK